MGRKKPISEYDEFLTSDEVEVIFGVSRTTLWRLRKKGIIPYKAIGRKIYIQRADVKKLLGMIEKEETNNGK
jgi:excisionase family DNA binding protein